MIKLGNNSLYSGNKNIFIADIHGEGDKLENLLSNLKSQTSLKDYRLIFLGDLIGKGLQTFKTLTIIKELKKEHEVIILKGNWEQTLLPLETKLVMLGYETLEEFISISNRYSFLKEFTAKGINRTSDFLDMWQKEDFNSVFSDLKLYFETESVLATHAPLTAEFVTRLITRKEPLDNFPTKLYMPFVTDEAEEIPLGKIFICGHQNCAIKDTVREKPSVYKNKIFLDAGGAGTTLAVPIYGYVEDMAVFIHS